MSNQTLQQLLTERVTAFANGDRPREIIEQMERDGIVSAMRADGSREVLAA